MEKQMVSKYRTDLGQAQNPATANVGLITQAAETQARAAMSGARATQAMIEGVTQMGEFARDVYVTGQKQELSTELKTEVSSLQSEMDNIKQADIANKTKLEEDVKSLPSMLEQFKLAQLQATNDPDAAKTATTLFGKTAEDSMLTRFREEQQRIVAARDAMPQRQHEFMLRAEEVLKKYIAQSPGLAGEFRQVAAQVTGKERIDLYSVNRLYEDVDFIEKQRQQQAKNMEKAAQMALEAYIYDREKSGISKTQAMAEFHTVTPEQRMELARASAEATRAASDMKNTMDMGGNQILNIANMARLQFDNNMLVANATVYAQIQQKFGVSRSQIASGNIPDSITNSTEYKKLIDEAGTKTLTLLDAMYKESNDSLQAKLRTNPADADKVNTAINTLRDWYTTNRKFYTENKTSFLIATATSGDREATLSRRLSLVNTFVGSLGLPPEVVANLGMTGDSKAYNDAKIRYPRAAKSLEYANTLREKAMSGVTSDEWFNYLKDIDSYKNGDTTIPTTQRAASAALISHSQLAEKVKKASLTGVTPTSTQDSVDLVRSSFISPANAEQFLNKSVTAYADVASKVSPAERTAAVEQIKRAAVDAIYGELGHGNNAKARYDKFIASAGNFPNVASTATVFSDTTGNSALRMTVNRTPRENLSQQELLTFERYNKVATQPTAVNGALADIDSMLRIQAQTTNTPIQQLRKEFMNSFMPEGRVSDNFTKTTAKATNEATQSKTITLEKLQEFAKTEKMDITDAIAQAIRNGYTIKGQ